MEDGEVEIRQLEGGSVDDDDDDDENEDETLFDKKSVGRSFINGDGTKLIRDQMLHSQAKPLLLD